MQEEGAKKNDDCTIMNGSKRRERQKQTTKQNEKARAKKRGRTRGKRAGGKKRPSGDIGKRESKATQERTAKPGKPTKKPQKQEEKGTKGSHERPMRGR